MLAREIQEVRKGQISRTLVNNQRAETEKSLQQAVEKQGRDILEMRKQLNLWTRNTSAREAYTGWAHQQANPNLNYGASSSSQTDQQDPVPLRTAPPLPGYQPP
ncbi:hypothetical protein PIB30_099428, partial [Stylosanthes scabra]|nr:hypothetical protein [Stylosanthes scabra]